MSTTNATFGFIFGPGSKIALRQNLDAKKNDAFNTGLTDEVALPSLMSNIYGTSVHSLP